MDLLYLETTDIMQKIHQGLAHLESSRESKTVSELEMFLRQQLELADKNCKRLGLIASKQPVNRRRHAQQLVDQLHYDLNQANMAFEKIILRFQEFKRCELEREELLSRRYKANETTSIYMDDAALVYNEKLHSTNRYVDDMILSGQSILENLQFQAFSMKNIRKRLIDYGNTLGLSNTIMGLIERRTDTDMKILFVGMFLTLIFMYLFYRLWLG